MIRQKSAQIRVGIFVFSTDMPTAKKWTSHDPKVVAGDMALDCHPWQGPDNVGANYRNAVIDYVTRLTNAGLITGTGQYNDGPDGLPRFSKGLDTLLNTLAPTRARIILLNWAADELFVGLAGVCFWWSNTRVPAGVAIARGKSASITHWLSLGSRFVKSLARLSPCRHRP